MKKILAAVALALVGTGSMAGGVIMVTGNGAGGRIELSDVPCKPEVDKAGYVAKAWSPSVDDAYGCWQFGPNGDTVEVAWNIVGAGWKNRTYVLNGFKVTPYGEKNYGTEQPAKAPSKPALKNEKQV